jgi:hypothetical protein
MQCLLPYVGRVKLPYFWDITPGTLPRPDLNPLANPALERNLNRWAEVYFGNPPGKREEAIGKLLQEIKNETSEILIAERARREAAARAREIRSTEIRSTKSQDVNCPICQHRNPQEHQFCGQCGGGLNPVQSGSSGSSVFTATQPPGNEPQAQPDSEVHWLRDRALGHLYDAEDPAWRGWKYLLGGLAIAVVGFAYVQWDLSRPNRVVSTVTAPAPRMTAPASPLPSDKPSSLAIQRPPEAVASAPNPPAPALAAPKLADVQPALVNPEVQEAQDVQDRKIRQRGLQPAATRSSLLGATSTPRAVESGNSGSADLQLAQRYLGGSMGVRDSTEAAKLLWKAVGKQNATAAILLSGLYARGDGVPKSCDQARLLLLGATRHGSPQAAEQLRDLERRGCR